MEVDKIAYNYDVNSEKVYIDLKLQFYSSFGNKTPQL